MMQRMMDADEKRLEAKRQRTIIASQSDGSPVSKEAIEAKTQEIQEKKTKNGKDYWIISTTDSNAFDANIRCWGVKEDDRISLNKVYIANLE